MKVVSRHMLIGVILIIFFSSNHIGAAEQEDNNQQLKSIISELEMKIDDADKRMIAHPNFLEELRGLVEKYKSQLRELFFKDSFDDGDYNTNPKWVVKSGSFSINKSGHLSSFVAMQTNKVQVDEQSEQDKSLEAEAVGILLDSIFGQKKKQESAQNPTQPLPKPVQPASIYAQKIFPPTFEMNIKFKSSQEGEMDITLLGSEKLLPRYRLKININHSEEEPIEIVRESSSRSFIVGASNKYPVINDGEFHTLSWIRLTNGAMNILIDGDIVLQTVEVYYRDNFSGFEITNKGGSYEWDSFEIYKALKPKAE